MPLNPNTVTINDAPIGTEQGLVTRPIFRKKTTIETNTALVSGGAFTGAWHDSEQDGTVFVRAWSFSNQAGNAAGIVIQQSDDPANSNLTQTPSGGSTIGANSLGSSSAPITARFWRVVYTNGATAQGSFELTSCAMNFVPLGGGQLIGSENNSGGLASRAVPVLFTTPAAAYGDNNLNTAAQYTTNSTGGVSGVQGILLHGGTYSGTAAAAKQSWSKARSIRCTFRGRPLERSLLLIMTQDGLILVRLDIFRRQRGTC